MEDTAKLPGLARGPGAALAPSEAATLASARAGDERVAQAIYEEQAPVLLRRLRFLACDAALAEDLIQETFAVAFTSGRPFDGRSKLSTWLHGIAFNLVRRHQAKETRRSQLRLRLPAPVEIDSARVEALVEQRDALRILDAALSKLDLPKREAFVLRVIEGLSLKEAAAVVGESPATVSYRARAAEESIRRFVAEMEQPDDV